MLKEAQAAVCDFSRAFNLPISRAPTQLGHDRVALRAKWMKEEIEEFVQAESIVDQADAIADLIYYALGVLVEMGIDGSRIFEIVHTANMAKRRAGGLPQYEQDGKVAKPEGWTSPKTAIQQWLTKRRAGKNL